MAPPKVDLNGKQPLEDVQGWAEQVGEMKLPPLPEETVAVETSTTVFNKRLLAKKRCKVCIGFVIITVVLVAAALAAGIFIGRHRRHHHWRGHVEDRQGHRSEEDIRTEGSRKLIFIARNESNHFFRMLAVLDYGTQMAGFKDCRRSRCYVDRLRESYEDGCTQWRHYMRNSRMPEERPLRVGPVIDRAVLKYIGGEEIASVCNNVPTHWVLEIPPGAPHDDTAEIIYL